MNTLGRTCDACKEGKHSKCSNVIKEHTERAELTYVCICCGNMPDRSRKLKEWREQRDIKDTETDINEENSEDVGSDESGESDEADENDQRYYYSTASVVSPLTYVPPYQYNKLVYRNGGYSISGKTAKEVTSPPNCAPIGNDIYHHCKDDDVFHWMDYPDEETNNENVEDLLIELEEAVECNKESLDKLKDRLEPVISKYIPASVTLSKNNDAQQYSPIKNKLLKILYEVEYQNSAIHRLLKTTKDLE